MKKMMMLVMMFVLAVSFVVPMAWAEEKSILSEDEVEFQRCLIALDKLEKGCPYSFSEELALNGMLKDIVKELDEDLSKGSLSKEEISQLLVIKTRAEEILAGPCCQTIRSFKEVQEMLFNLKKDFKTPSLPPKQWWEGLD